MCAITNKLFYIIACDASPAGLVCETLFFSGSYQMSAASD